MNTNHVRQSFVLFPSLFSVLFLSVLFFSVLFLSGCGPAQPARPAASPPVTPPATPKVEPPKTVTPAPATTPTTPVPETSPVPETPTTTKKAEAGVGAKGHDLGSGVISTPAAALFTIRERVIFEVRIPQALQLFKATENRAPKSHGEFMEEIIKASQIKLPELQPGETYRYDPKLEMLMVDKKAA
jgi:hypothetical protein